MTDLLGQGSIPGEPNVLLLAQLREDFILFNVMSVKGRIQSIAICKTPDCYHNTQLVVELCLLKISVKSPSLHLLLSWVKEHIVPYLYQGTSNPLG